jgi:hypothetical protein
MLTSEQILQIVTEYGITVEMLHLAILVDEVDRPRIGTYRDIYLKYHEKFPNPKELEGLVQQKFIERLPNGKYVATNKFRDLFVDKFKASHEFFNAYPTYIKSADGKSYPLKNVDIRVFQDIYGTVIKTKSEHELVMQALHYAIHNDYGFVKIDVFIKNRMFDQIINDMNERGTSNLSTIIENDF